MQTAATVIIQFWLLLQRLAELGEVEILVIWPEMAGRVAPERQVESDLPRRLEPAALVEHL
jgi:hypothetical protein